MDCPICASANVIRGGAVWNSRCGSCGWTWDDPSLLPSIEVADSIGEVIGWRAWDVVDTPDGVRIKSQGAGGAGANDLWNPGEVLSARCAKGNGHRSPDEGCTCGFYAAANREHLTTLSYHRYDQRHANTIIGEVYMDGKVVPATLGFRAENIWPMRMVVPTTLPVRNLRGIEYGWQLASALIESYGQYGVTVDLQDTLRAKPRGQRTTEWCHCGRMKNEAGKCPRHG